VRRRYGGCCSVRSLLTRTPDVLGRNRTRAQATTSPHFWHLGIIILIAASSIPILASLRLARPIDDAYITLSYARSLSEGRGFTFGEFVDKPTLGTTAPLYAALLAVASRLLPFSAMPRLAIALSVVAWLATAWLWAWQGPVLGLSRLERLCVALLLLIETNFWVSALGMETRLFCFLLSLSLFVYFRGWHFWAGLLTGLLFLTRGEGFLMFAALGIYQVLSDVAKHQSPIHKLMRMVAGGMIALAPWAIYAWFTFGSLLPNTLAAKAAQLSTGSHFSFLPFAASMMIVRWSSLSLSGVNMWLVLAILGLILAFLGRRKLLVLALWLLLFVAGYTAIGAPGYDWYVLPILFIVVIFAGLGIGALPRWLIRHRKPGRSEGTLSALYKRLGTIISVAALIAVCVIVLPRSIPEQTLDAPSHDVYRRIAEWINARTPRPAKVAFVEVGYLSWYCRCEVVDLLGLTRPDLIPAIKEKNYLLAFQEAAPDYLIYTPDNDFWLKAIVTNPGFLHDFRPVATFPRSDASPMTLYEHIQVAGMGASK
jgi:arabinofuranosyltransferase